MANNYPLLSPYVTGLRCWCPRCGAGDLFVGLLTIVKRCSDCDLDFRAQDSGVGTAIFLIFIVGPIVTGLAFWFEMFVSLPLWLHIVFWFPVITVGSAALSWLLKAFLVALQFHHKVDESGTWPF